MDPPWLCAKGCGFYSSMENKNMCSKCIKDYLKEEVISKTKLQCVVDDNLNISNTSSYACGCSSSSESHCHSHHRRFCSCEKQGQEVEICKKKVGLTSFRCRCSGVFCPKHRYLEEHSCDVDFKKARRELPAKQNAFALVTRCNGDFVR